jgi:pilus assembly protein CpaE
LQTDDAPREEPSLAKVELTAAIVVRDEGSAEIIRQSLNDLGSPDPRSWSGTAKTAAKIFARERSPRLLIVDISGIDPAAASILQLSEVCQPETRIVAIGDRNDVAFYRSLRRTGIADYIAKPLVRGSLSLALNSAVSPSGNRPVWEGGKLIFILGVRGGCGSTAIAAGIASALAQSRGQRTALLDLDVENGDAAMRFRPAKPAIPEQAFEQAECSRPLEAGFVSNQVQPRLDLVSSTLRAPTDETSLGEDQIAALLDRLQLSYRYVIVDLPWSAALQFRGLLRRSCTCLMVGNPSLTAARDVARWRDVFGANTLERTAVHVLNATQPHGGLSTMAFAAAAGWTPDHVIPYDAAGAASCAVAGARRKSKFSLRLHSVIDNLTEACEEQRASVLKKVLQPSWPLLAKG